ncbi:SET domain-containing protein [Bimuria novae-zelandiae CBS 107.79]|uniref:Ribosomal lysine N-methyltransferase 4 n=1 Tax=Bimuria novae-zelandiae CBS 107.79 TaxID=1447943 RepID=A0A6A5VFB4_9PLEO|nr:SET domain-containing protein [Bimuria novae-zelandiae CBS 107.79]
MDSFNEASQVFLEWLKRSGAEISPKIELKDLRNTQAGRGVVSTQDIGEDELLFSVPRSAILSVENSILSNEIPKATLVHLGPWLSLILVMIYEYIHKDASNWATYFAVLPSEFNTLMFWSEDELAELQASAVVHKIGRQSADESFKNELIPVIKEFASVIFAGDPQAKEKAAEMESEQGMLLMHKMGSLIMAYAFDVEPAQSQKELDEEGYASEDEDEALPKGMVPMADMLNADADRNNARLFYEEATLIMKTLKPIKAGEEIFNDYGPLPRSDLLRRYGYITDNYAQYDVVEIPFDLVAQTATAANVYSEARCAYLDEHDLIEIGYDICASDPFTVQESLSPELIVVVETLLLDDDEFERLKRKGKLPKPEKITAKSAEFMHRLVQVRLQQYPTTLNQDVGTATPLTGEATSKECRYAIAKQVRIGEKKILKQTEEALEQLGRDLVSANGSAKRQAEEEEAGPGKKKRAR